MILVTTKIRKIDGGGRELVENVIPAVYPPKSRTQGVIKYEIKTFAEREYSCGKETRELIKEKWILVFRVMTPCNLVDGRKMSQHEKPKSTFLPPIMTPHLKLVQTTLTL
jgi:hypothetical protein